MKKNAATISVVLCFSLFLFCAAHDGVAAPDTKKIAAQAAKELMASTPTHVLLDVRTEEEFANGHIQGARLLPYTEITSRASSELSDKEMLIIVYCRAGRRSAIAASELARMGYANVYDLGSIYDWPDRIVTK